MGKILAQKSGKKCLSNLLYENPSSCARIHTNLQADIKLWRKPKVKDGAQGQGESSHLPFTMNWWMFAARFSNQNPGFESFSVFWWICSSTEQRKWKMHKMLTIYYLYIKTYQLRYLRNSRVTVFLKSFSNIAFWF